MLGGMKIVQACNFLQSTLEEISPFADSGDLKIKSNTVPSKVSELFCNSIAYENTFDTILGSENRF